MKKCNDCKIADAVSKKRPYCRPCRNARERKGYNPASDRNRHIKLYYGIDIVEYDRLYALQSGRCAICKEPKEILDIDHDHKSKKVRGLLCRSCNVFLGRIESNPDILRKMLAYKKYHGKNK